MGRTMEGQARPDAFSSRAGGVIPAELAVHPSLCEHVIMQGGLFVCRFISGKLWHSEHVMHAEKFKTFDEADDFWRSKMNSPLDVIIMELPK
jgi:hypothetical protein